MRAHVRTRTDFGRIRLIWQNLAEVDQAGRIWQNSVKASSLSCRVFYRDIPTVTRLVPLQYYLNLSILLNLNLGFPLNQSGLLGLNLGFLLGLSGPLSYYLAYLQFSQLESLLARLRQQGEVEVSLQLNLSVLLNLNLSVPLNLNLDFLLNLSGLLSLYVLQLNLQLTPKMLYKGTYTYLLQYL